jgi:hypothetical protein
VTGLAADYLRRVADGDPLAVAVGIRLATEVLTGAARKQRTG